MSKFKSAEKGQSKVKNDHYHNSYIYNINDVFFRFLEREILFDQDEEERGSVIGYEDLIKDNITGKLFPPTTVW